MKKAIAIKTFLPLCASALIFSSCTTMADYNYSTIDKNLNTANYSEVYAELNSEKKSPYKKTDQVLATLDKGLISHYSENYEKSNDLLSQSENLMDKFSAVSISQQIGSMIANDTVIDYPGDPYEDIYISIFKTLNYLKLNKKDDAFVEIRRVNIKLNEISHKYQATIEKQRKELKENAQSIPEASMKFHNSALARYLSMLMYRSEGNYDDALIDQKGINEAFKMQNELYDFEIPSSIKEELKISANEARLNLLAFSGRCPIKIKQNTPLFAVNGFYKIATPVMKERKSPINRVTFTCKNTETGETISSEAQLFESIENIAFDTYEQKYSLIIAKTIGRMILKLTSSVALDVAAKKTEDSKLGLILSLISFASKANIFLSERADVRCSRYFPSYAWVDGITIPQGNYDVTVNFKKGNSSIASYTYNDVKVKNGEMNLVESFCLR